MASVKSLLCALVLAVMTCGAQTPPQGVPPPLPSPSPQTVPPAQTPAPQPDPAITQIRKSVTFIKLRCADGGQEFDVRGTGFFVFYPSDFLKQHRIVEGEPLFFAGFFYQFPGSKRMEPIVRQGIIAMMPSDKVPFVGMAEKVYLADLHAFGGNSGSPAFINLGGYHAGSMMLGDDYRLLGVVNGGLTEDENFNLELTATLKGKGAANSGISTIVPADEVQALLDDPRLQKLRDDAVKAQATGAGQK